MNGNNSAFEIISFAGTLAVLIIAFVALLEIPVSSQQQQAMSTPVHHPDNGNQSSGNSTEQQQYQNGTTTSGGIMPSRMMDQTFNKTWISLLSDVKVTEISIIDNQHIVVNLRYDGEGPTPGASILVVAMISNSSTTLLPGQKGGEMMGMILPNNHPLNSSTGLEQELELQLQQHQQISSSNSVINSIMQILPIQSGSNYLEAGWQGQGSKSGTVLVALDGDITKAEHIMVGVVPFLHH